jgi:hypothetical protein
MEGLKSFYEHLRNLRSQAEKLLDAGSALNTLFAEEEIRLKREDEVSKLRAAYRSITEKLDELRRIEGSASYGYIWAKPILFLTGLAAEAIFSKGNLASVAEDYLARGRTDIKQPLGLVMVSIGPRGLPDDLGVISVSQLARESRRSESEIVNESQQRGNLLFGEETFSLLIDRLVTDIREGRLHLPISRDKLAEIAESNEPESRITIVPIRIVPIE